MDRFHSPSMPSIPFQIGTSQMGDLFANFYVAWSTLMPVLVILFGILLAFAIIHMFKDEFESDKKISAGIRSAIEKLNRKR